MTLLNDRKKKMINLFIDSNIWLNLYDNSKETLESFDQLFDLVGIEVNLLLTEQVKDEIYRNRDNRIKQALASLKVSKINLPVFARVYEESEKIEDSYKKLINYFDNLLEQINIDIVERKLAADEVIDKFFMSSELLNTNDVFDSALKRHQIGNPPGKKNSYGDSINWECLLYALKEGDDVYIISNDDDYETPLRGHELNSYLKEEWKSVKKANAYLYKCLADFIKDMDLEIKSFEVKEEKEKNLYIEQLYESGSFAETHLIIEKLNNYTNWNFSQIRDLCKAARINTQVGGILSDIDVRRFFIKILNTFDFSDTEDIDINEINRRIFGDSV